MWQLALLLLPSVLGQCPTHCLSCDTNDNCLGPNGEDWATISNDAIFCQDGWWGQTCSTACPTGCLHSYCSSEGYCMATRNENNIDNDYNTANSGDAAIYCLPGFYGSDCSSVCPTTCSQPYCSGDGYCIAQVFATVGGDYESAGSYDKSIWCIDGYYGISCEYNCPTTCAQAYCSDEGYCMATPVRSPLSDYFSAASADRASWCQDGYYGSTCEYTCPTNCAQKFCSAYGYCMAFSDNLMLGGEEADANGYSRPIYCKDGFYGSDCSGTCPTNCAQPYCDVNGDCIATPTQINTSDYSIANANDRASWCKDGYWGSDCTSTCPTHCAQAYCSGQGNCIACPTRVSPMGDYSSSDQYDRARFCQDGYYDQTCGSSCPTHCARAWCSAQGYCLNSTDRVPLGDFGAATNTSVDPAIWCVDGYYSNDCSQSCSAPCATACSADGSCNLCGSTAGPNNYNRLTCVATTSAPAACTSALGMCSWYSSCLAGAIFDSCPSVLGSMAPQCTAFSTAPGISVAAGTWNTQRETCIQNRLESIWMSDNQYGAKECGRFQTEYFNNMLPCFTGTTQSFCKLSPADQLSFMMHGNPLLTGSNWYDPTFFGATVQAACDSYYYQIDAHLLTATSFTGVGASLLQLFQNTVQSRWEIAWVNISASSFAVGVFQNANYTGNNTIYFPPWYVSQAVLNWQQTTLGSQYYLTINGGARISAAPTTGTPSFSPTTANPTTPTRPTTRAPSRATTPSSPSSPTNPTTAGSPTKPTAASPTAPTALGGASALSVALSMSIVLCAASLLPM